MHSSEQIDQIVNSINEFGFNDPIEIGTDNVIISGHGRLAAAIKLGLTKVPVVIHEHLKGSKREAYVLAANKIAMNSTWDLTILKDRLVTLDHEEQLLTGFSEDELDDLLNDEEFDNDLDNKNSKFTDKFLIPPFSIFDTRQGYWQERKKLWLKLNIQSELGRNNNNAEQVAIEQSNFGEKYGRPEKQDAPSIFDPVLCELIYRWFSAPHSIVIDPFAGGSVRGIVASKCDRQYIGVELREEQVSENRVQAYDLCENEINNPLWHIGDSRDIVTHLKNVQADLLFSCPPYADLEKYSDNPKDISILSYEEFIEAYNLIIKESCSLLKNDSFAVFVVGDIRDKKGFYRNFVSDTINAFLIAGLKLYNEAILINPVGSLAIRAGKPFESSRKLGKTHQNVLIFIKGDAKKATAKCGIVDIPDLENYLDEY